MTLLEVRPAADATSAAGPMISRPVRELFLIGCLITGPGTSSAASEPPDELYRRSVLQTSAGRPLDAPSNSEAVSAIAELRRLSGLTWEQLAELLQVSRRALHFWASGKPMNAANEARLQGVLAVIREMDRGNARENRSLLLAVKDGQSALSLLASGGYDAARERLGGAAARRPERPAPLSREERLRRAPRPPEELVDARDEPIQTEGQKVRAAKSVRQRGGA